MSLSCPLEAARTAAVQAQGYNSKATRQAINDQFKRVFDGKDAFKWQLDTTEALLLGLDCVVIAGTGAGKTMPFAMPLLIEGTNSKMILIISPLNALQLEQVNSMLSELFFPCSFMCRLRDFIAWASQQQLLTVMCTRPNYIRQVLEMLSGTYKHLPDFRQSSPNNLGSFSRPPRCVWNMRSSPSSCVHPGS